MENQTSELITAVRKRTEENWDDLIDRVKAEVDKLKNGVEDWPIGQCRYASINLCNRLGLTGVSGEYIGPGKRHFITDHHIWNLDSDKRFEEKRIWTLEELAKLHQESTSRFIDATNTAIYA